ncbi:antigen 5 like allergen Cul n 1-like [Aedes albopictus]|uniref:SCP domain-containing protein n=1 Tax=Aedes albopictus TaxID=7160 RepID=A0ABM1ZDH5_AEDAL|nr:venom allergen 3-like [Aedes albopictus]
MIVLGCEPNQWVKSIHNLNSTFNFLDVLAALVTRSFQQSINYCKPSLCPVQKPHIACNVTSKFGPKCGTIANIVPMNSTNVALIVSMHNLYRSVIAQGKLNYTKQEYFPTAERMPTIQWDDELAYIAEANARHCVFEHDKCRNTEQLKSAGQNLAWISYYGFFQTDAKLISQMINYWYREYIYADRSIISNYPKNYGGPAIGHFTAMVADRSNRIGCAMVSFEESPWMRKYLVCNYSITNIINQPVYKAGPTASKCVTGQNPDYAGLCSVDEVIDSNPFKFP